MVFEDGVDWKPLEPRKRGHHTTFGSAVDAAVRELLAVKDPFFDSLPEKWDALFPGLAARPGRYESGMLVLFVKDAPHLFAIKPKIASVRKRLLGLDGAPRNLKVILEIRT